MQTSRRGFLGMLGAVTTTAYFFAPVGGWSSNLIINPNDLPAPTIHKAKAIYGKYNWMLEGDGYNPRPYKRHEVRIRPMSALPHWTSGTAHLISV